MTEEMPDKNCVTEPDGLCVGTDCMHDAPKREISIDITPEGFHVSLPQRFGIEDVKNILTSVRDLLVQYLTVQHEAAKLARLEKTLDNDGNTDNTETSLASDTAEPERG